MGTRKPPLQWQPDRDVIEVRAELLADNFPRFALERNPRYMHARPENLVEVQSKEALPALTREMPQDGRHQPDPVGGGGALPELVDEEE